MLCDSSLKGQAVRCAFCFFIFVFGFIKTKRFVWRDKLKLDQRLKLPLASVYIQSDWQNGKQEARSRFCRPESTHKLEIIWCWFKDDKRNVLKLKLLCEEFLQTNNMFDFVCFHWVLLVWHRTAAVIGPDAVPHLLAWNHWIYSTTHQESVVTESSI